MKFIKLIDLETGEEKEYTSYSVGGFFRKNRISAEEYYNRFFKKENEGKCKICGNDTSFRGLWEGYSKYCKGCQYKDPEFSIKAKKTYKDRTGFEHNSKNPSNREKVKKTCLEKYNTEHFSRSIKVKEKIRLTCLERYNSKSYLSSDKNRETILEKFNVKNVFQNNEIKEKIKITNKKYRDDYFSNELFPKSYTLLKLEKDNVEYTCDSGHTHVSSRQLLYKRFKSNNICCEICNPIGSITESSGERELHDFIKTIYDGEIIKRFRDKETKKEIDVFLPDLKIGFEYNGCYFHSTARDGNKRKHIDKTLFFKDKEIRIIHIFEDDWLYKRDIVKSRIQNILGESRRIFARKCEVKEVSNNDYKKFIEENHIQGYAVSSVRLGLYENKSLVSIITFSKPRMNKDYQWELIRFCNSKNVSVVGAASKLLKYFEKKYNPENIISYADYCWSDGNLYSKLGFKFISLTEPNYSYLVNGIRENRFKYRKSELVKEGFDSNLSEEQIMLERGIYRIYDCGSMIFAK